MTSSGTPNIQRFLLPLTGVRVECLDEKQLPLPGAVASGFIRREKGTLYLYTAWHVVTGYDPHHINVGFALPPRRFIRLTLQDVQDRGPGVQVIGSSQSTDLPLYADPQASDGSLEPLWQQNDQHVPHKLLNAVGLFVPFWHDVVKIALPDSIRASEPQLVADDQILKGDDSLVSVGEKCFIVGFPYGFSAAFDVDQPTPLVFTRFIASTATAGARKHEFLLDGYGAPGMSGGPVFLEREKQLFLIGAYTGDVFPDHKLHRSEKTTALGTVADLRVMLAGHIAMTARPSSPVG